MTRAGYGRLSMVPSVAEPTPPMGVRRGLETTMLTLIRKVLDQRAGSLRGPLIGIYGVLFVANLGVWAWALLVFRDQPLYLGTALLA